MTSVCFRRRCSKQHVRREDGTSNTFYLPGDHLGSVDVMLNSAAAIVVRTSFDVWGGRRDDDWIGAPSSGEITNMANTSRHGFTGHEMLDNVNLVHMNGRVYDPTIGRFLSADPFVVPALGTQGFNRYAYVGNRPLSYTDPSGFIPITPDSPNYSDDWDFLYPRWDECFGYCDPGWFITVGDRRSNPAGSRHSYRSVDGNPLNNPQRVREEKQAVSASVTADTHNVSTVDGTASNPRLVIGFRGAGIGLFGLEGDTPSLTAFVEELGGQMYEHGPLSRAAAVRAARAFAAANPNGQIVLTGYSRGGRAAFAVANALGDTGIGVQALILFDAHDLNDDVLRLEHGNVANALNFYQQNPTTSIFGGNPFSGRPLAPYMIGSPNHRRFRPGLIRGHNYTGELGVGHLNIVSTSLRRYEELIREALE